MENIKLIISYIERKHTYFYFEKGKLTTFKNSRYLELSNLEETLVNENLTSSEFPVW